VDFRNEISLGQIIQALTVAGSVVSAIFAAGAYVQHLTDRLADNRQAAVASDAQITAAIQRLQAAQAAQAAQAQTSAAQTAQAAQTAVQAVQAIAKGKPP
jgi:hypothetical protein